MNGPETRLNSVEQASLKQERFLVTDHDVDSTRRLTYPEAEQQYQAFDILPVPIAIIGRNYHKPLEYGNPAYHKLSPEHIGAISSVLNVPIIETEKGVLSTLQAVEAGRGIRTIRVHITDGPWYELTVSPVPGLDGETNALVMIYDITEHKLRERELIRIQEEEGRRRDEDLKRVVHDLKNPFTAIRGHAEFAQLELKKEEPRLEVVAKSFDSIVQGTKKCTDMVVGEIEILKLSPELRREIIPIADVLETVRNEHLDQLEQTGIESKFCLPGSDLKLVGDAKALSSVLRILTVNAIHSMDRMNAGKSRRLTVSFQVKGGRITIYVTDTGEGIPEEHWKRIFEGYSTKINTDHQGTGIGIPAARAIARAHGGDVQLIRSITEKMLQQKPELGQTGSTFVVLLPLLQEKS